MLGRPPYLNPLNGDSLDASEYTDTGPQSRIPHLDSIGEMTSSFPRTRTNRFPSSRTSGATLAPQPKLRERPTAGCAQNSVPDRLPGRVRIRLRNAYLLK